jgi:hypothetical protein
MIRNMRHTPHKINFIALRAIARGRGDFPEGEERRRAII